MKPVSRPGRRWRLMELASGAFHQLEIQYRFEKRCQLIAAGGHNACLEGIKEGLEACIVLMPAIEASSQLAPAPPGADRSRRTG